MFWVVLVLSMMSGLGLLSFIALVATWHCIAKSADEFFRGFWR